MTTTGSASALREAGGSPLQGDRRAIESLWQEHRRWIAAVILAYKPRTEDLDDLLQEVAMTLVSKIDTIREEANIRAWLRVVAINAARAAGRSQRTRHALRLSESESSSAPLAPDTLDPGLDEHARHALAMVSGLPEIYREPLLLKAVHGMRTRQIAEILGVEEATVDTRVSRARRMLREKAEVDEASPRRAPLTV